MTVFVALVLTVLTFAFVTYPLFKHRLHSYGAVEQERLRELSSKRNITYSMLKEREFDFQSALLTDEDYRELEARYKGKAISVLRDIDSLQKSTEVEEKIEKQVLGLRRGKGRFCPQCGAKCQEDDRFCSRCGTSLSKGELN